MDASTDALADNDYVGAGNSPFYTMGNITIGNQATLITREDAAENRITETVGNLPAAPTRTGYEFTGWNTNADGTGTKFKADTPVTQNIPVYAQWKSNGSGGGGSGGGGGSRIYYELTFESNGGTPIPAKRVKGYTTVQLTPVSTRQRHTFEGWYTEPEKPDVPADSQDVPAEPEIHAKLDKLPKTGDSSMAGFWLIMSILSGLGLSWISKRKRCE